MIIRYLKPARNSTMIETTRRDLQELRRRAQEATPYQGSSVAIQNVQSRKSLRRNVYFRAGIMGLPLCIVEWFWKHELIFLLGGGFFAGLLGPTLYAEWKWNRVQKAKQGSPD